MKGDKEMYENAEDVIRDINNGRVYGCLELLSINKALFRVQDWIEAGWDRTNEIDDERKRQKLDALYDRASALADILGETISKIQDIERSL